MGAKRSKIRRQVRTTGANPDYLASCYGKVRRTKQEAHGRADEITTMKAYKCRWCEWYHVGRKPGSFK